MQTHRTLLLVLALSSLGSGCVGSGPNTQQGAVIGGATGALAGAIIGNNSHGRNALGGAVIGGVVGAIAGGTIGNSIDQQRGTIYGSEREATTAVVVAQPPPPPPSAPTEYVPPQPAPGSVWVPGYWAFDGYRYVWVAGCWQIPPRYHYAYISPHWAYRDGGYVFIRGYWR
ncbi:MAG: glycine zipper domain-containing protein [Opitutaceae bacterium]|jgi:hypothetical protein